MSSKYGNVMKKQFRLNLWFSVFVLLTMISCGSDDKTITMVQVLFQNKIVPPLLLTQMEPLLLAANLLL